MIPVGRGRHDLPDYQSYRAGETVILRARITEDCSNLFGAALAPVIVEDYPDGQFVSRAFAPFSEVGRLEDPADITRLLQPRTIDPRTAKRSPER